MNKVWVALLASAVSWLRPWVKVTVCFIILARMPRTPRHLLETWGSGTISDTDETAFQGSATRFVFPLATTFKAESLDFGTPIDVAKVIYLVKTNSSQNCVQRWPIVA